MDLVFVFVCVVFGAMVSSMNLSMFVAKYFKLLILYWVHLFSKTLQMIPNALYISDNLVGKMKLIVKMSRFSILR